MLSILLEIIDPCFNVFDTALKNLLIVFNALQENFISFYENRAPVLHIILVGFS